MAPVARWPSRPQPKAESDDNASAANTTGVLLRSLIRRTPSQRDARGNAPAAIVFGARFDVPSHGRRESGSGWASINEEWRENEPRHSGPKRTDGTASLAAMSPKHRSSCHLEQPSGAKGAPSFYPTIETVLLAGTPWLAFLCPACRTVSEVDVSTLDRHPMMPISGLIPSLSCRWCCSNPPFAKLLELTEQSTIAAALRKSRKR
jgi:hypothetical protein